MKLNQVWNIFRKDVRHQWIEIIVSLVLMVGFAWAEIGEWSQRGGVAYGPAFFIYGLLSGLAVPLLPISWMFLIVRSVQSESLAGDRQFWVTRPYEWTNLLLAKILFVLLFVNVPLFLAQAFLVHKAGFHPTHYIGGLLWLQLMWILILLLPTAALATVTRNIGHMLLALLFVGLFAIGLSILAQAVPNSGFSGWVVSVDLLLITIATAVAILLQYSLRRTAQSRWLIAGLAAALTLILVAAPYRTLIARAYPPAGSDFPVQLSLTRPPSSVGFSPPTRIPLNFNFNLSGVEKDSFLELNGVIVTLNNSAGRHWDSGWEGRSGTFFPDEKMMATSVQIGKDDLDKLRSSPITADVLIAVTLYHDQNARPFVVPRGEFSFPDVGYCSSFDPTSPNSNLNCRIALRRPRFLMVTSEMAASTCPLSKDQVPPKPGEIARAFIRNDSGSVEFGLSPILMDGISLWQASTNRVSGICPGTPLTLSNPEVVTHRRIEVHVDRTWFDAYLAAVSRGKQ